MATFRSPVRSRSSASRRNAVVVAESKDLPELLSVLQQQQEGAARLIAADAGSVPASGGPGESLLDHVRAHGWDALVSLATKPRAGVRL